MKPRAVKINRNGWLLVLIFLTGSLGLAQKINFGAYTTSQGIALTASSGYLNFNSKQPFLVSNSNITVTIALVDNEAQYIKIVADATRDITITIGSPPYLIIGVGGVGNQIPFTCNFAYSNLGIADEPTARLNAVQVPSGFSAITLPMMKRASGTPLPPPTPAHGGYTAPSATAYLFLYGSLGPLGNVNAGDYSGLISVSVNYSTN